MLFCNVTGRQTWSQAEHPASLLPGWGPTRRQPSAKQRWQTARGSLSWDISHDVYRGFLLPTGLFAGEDCSRNIGVHQPPWWTFRDLERLGPSFRAACQNTCWEAVGRNACGLLYWFVFSVENLGKWHTSLGEIQWPWYLLKNISTWKHLTCYKLQIGTRV